MGRQLPYRAVKRSAGDGRLVVVQALVTPKTITTGHNTADLKQAREELLPFEYESEDPFLQPGDLILKVKTLPDELELEDGATPEDVRDGWWRTSDLDIRRLHEAFVLRKDQQVPAPDTNDVTNLHSVIYTLNYAIVHTMIEFAARGLIVAHRVSRHRGGRSPCVLYAAYGAGPMPACPRREGACTRRTCCSRRPCCTARGGMSAEGGFRARGAADLARHLHGCDEADGRGVNP